jgi:hypothetical protein
MKINTSVIDFNQLFFLLLPSVWYRKQLRSMSWEREKLEWDFCTSLVTTLSLFLASKECLGIFSNIYIPFITESSHSKHPNKKWKHFSHTFQFHNNFEIFHMKMKLSNSKKLLWTYICWCFLSLPKFLMSLKLCFALSVS